MIWPRTAVQPRFTTVCAVVRCFRRCIHTAYPKTLRLLSGTSAGEQICSCPFDTRTVHSSPIYNRPPAPQRTRTWRRLDRSPRSAGTEARTSAPAPAASPARILAGRVAATRIHTGAIYSGKNQVHRDLPPRMIQTFCGEMLLSGWRTRATGRHENRHRWYPNFKSPPTDDILGDR